MKRLFFLSALVFLLGIFSCEENVDPAEDDLNPGDTLSIDNPSDTLNNDTSGVNTGLDTTVTISGVVQKGPFINGTAIIVTELSPGLIQTGKTFSSQILDNQGKFELNQLVLNSRFIELRADGFYFNETLGRKSDAQLTLYALSDLSEEAVNVNLLSHLEKQRIHYLMSEGAIFSQAKEQAQEEILDIFGFYLNHRRRSESLDISISGRDNAVLLAASLIIQGYRDDATLSELLANMSTDLREDGKLDSEVIGTRLIQDAVLLRPEIIRQNLEERYAAMGIDADIPDFEYYLQKFIDETEFEIEDTIQYPATGEYGQNVLHQDSAVYTQHTNYSLTALLPPNQTVKVKLTGGKYVYGGYPSPENLEVTRYDEDTYEQTYTAIEPGKKCEALVRFKLRSRPVIIGDSLTYMQGTRDTVKIKFYENYAEPPTREITVFVEDD